MSRIFKDIAAKKKFAELYHKLPTDEQVKFGEVIRQLADQKVTRLDLVDDFYVDSIDVVQEFNKITTFL